MASTWELRLIGESVLADPNGLASDLSAKSKRFALLVFLAVPAPGRWVRRDVILATFWPELDTPRARNALRVMLHQLRNGLGPEIIRTMGDEQICLNPALLRVDLEAMREAVENGDAGPWLERDSLELVPGLHIADAAPFDEWLENQRQTFKAKTVSALWKLADQADHGGDLPRAIVASRAAIRLSSADESGLCRLLSLMDSAGDRAGALAEFESFERWLSNELDVAPAPETIALVRQIRERLDTNPPRNGMPFQTPSAEPVPLLLTSRPTSPRRLVLAAAVVAVLAVGIITLNRLRGERAEVLSARPATQPATSHKPDPRAYKMALDGDFLVRRRTREALLKARDVYTKALEIDPEWPDLWIGLARATGALAYRNFIDYRSGFQVSLHAADEALKRAPNDGRAYIERGMARFSLGDLPGAAEDMRRAAALDSTDYGTQSLIGTYWQWQGTLDSALYYTERARRLAPWDRQVSINIMQIVGCMDSVRTLHEARQVLDMDENEPEALETYAWTLTRFKRWDEATNAYEHRHAKQVAAGITRGAQKLKGEARFRATVHAIRKAEYDAIRVDSSLMPNLLEGRIALYEDLGMRDSAIAILSAVKDSVDAHHANMMCAPNLRGFRRDPRVLAIVKQRRWAPAEFATLP